MEIIKEETVFMKEELLPSSTVESTCSIFAHEEECELKKEMVYIKDEINVSSTVEVTCTVKKQEEDVKIKNTEIQDIVAIS